MCDTVEEYKNCSTLNGMSEEEALRFTNDFITHGISDSDRKPNPEKTQVARKLKYGFWQIIAWLLMIGGMVVAFLSYSIVTENVISNDGIIGIMIGIGILLFTIGRQLKDNCFILGSNLETEMVQYQQYYMEHFRTQSSDTETNDSDSADGDEVQRFAARSSDVSAESHRMNDFSRIGEKDVYFEHIRTMEEAKSFYPFFGEYLKKRAENNAPIEKGNMIAQIALDLVGIFAGGLNPIGARYTVDAVRGVKENNVLSEVAEQCIDLSILDNKTEEEAIAGVNEMIDIYNEVQFKHDHGKERLRVLKNVESVMSDNEQSEADDERGGNSASTERNE